MSRLTLSATDMALDRDLELVPDMLEADMGLELSTVLRALSEGESILLRTGEKAEDDGRVLWAGNGLSGRPSAHKGCESRCAR